MKTILVDAVDTFVIEGEGIFQPMYDLLEKYPNRKIVLTGANDDQMKAFGDPPIPPFRWDSGGMGSHGRNDPCWCSSGKKYKRCHYPN